MSTSSALLPSPYEMWQCASISPGRIVLPSKRMDSSAGRAAFSGRRLPDQTAATRPSSMRSVASATGAAPVPSISVAPVMSWMRPMAAGSSSELDLEQLGRVAGDDLEPVFRRLLGQDAADVLR